MDPTDRHIGRTLGEKYVIVAPLGKGGMGRVYRGVQLSVNRQVAIKLITGSTPHLPEWEQRFRREAEAMARLSHPNSIRLFDFGVTEAQEPYMVMELLDGVDLGRYLSEHGPLPLLPALQIARQILLALSEAHTLGIVHRDIKPDNVFLARVRGGDNLVKVMDFGIAGVARATRQHKLTDTGIIIGTPTYMSPEQARGETVGAPSDLYSLGVVLFEMLSCQHPFVSTNAMSVLVAHLTQPPRRLSDTGVEIQHESEVQALLDGLLEKQPEARPSLEATLSRVSALCALCAQSPNSAIALQPARQLRTPTTPAPHHTQRSAELPLSQLQALRARFRARRTPGLFAGTLALALGALALHFWPRAQEQLARLSVTEHSEHTANAERAQPDEPAAEPTHSVVITSVPSHASVALNGAELGTTPYTHRFSLPTTLTLSRRGYDSQTLQLTGHDDRAVSVKLVREKKPEVAPAVERSDERAHAEETEQAAAVDPDELERSQPERPASPAEARAPSRESTRDPAHIDVGAGDIDYDIPAWRRPLTEADDLPRVQNTPGRMFRHVLARFIGRIMIKPPSPARREQLLRRGILYPNVKAAWFAYDSGAIDRVTFHEAIWLLRERRRQRTQAADDDYAHGRTTRAEYTHQYDLISVEFWGE